MAGHNPGPIDQIWSDLDLRSGSTEVKRSKSFLRITPFEIAVKLVLFSSFNSHFWLFLLLTSGDKRNRNYTRMLSWLCTINCPMSISPGKILCQLGRGSSVDRPYWGPWLAWSIRQLHGPHDYCVGRRRAYPWPILYTTWGHQPAMSLLIMPRHPHSGGIKRWCASDICLTSDACLSVAYIVVR